MIFAYFKGIFGLWPLGAFWIFGLSSRQRESRKEKNFFSRIHIIYTHSGEGGGWSQSQCKILSATVILKFIFSLFVVVLRAKTRNNIERDYSQLHCFETIPEPFLKKNFQSQMS